MYFTFSLLTLPASSSSFAFMGCNSGVHLVVFYCTSGLFCMAVPSTPQPYYFRHSYYVFKGVAVPDLRFSFFIAFLLCVCCYYCPMLCCNFLQARATEVEGENARLKVIIKQKEEEIRDIKKV